MEQIKIPDYLEPTIEFYYTNNAKRLYDMVDKILYKLHFSYVDKNDFYSLANEVFMYTVRDYDETQSFDAFLYSCLYKKFCTEMTSSTRDKRCAKVKIKEKNEKGEIIEKVVIMHDVSIYTPVGDDENFTIGDMIEDNFSVEQEILKKEKKEKWREEIAEFIDNLSPLQRKIAILLSDNNSPAEICEELHITIKHFENSMKRISSDERIKPLRSLVGRM